MRRHLWMHAGMAAAIVAIVGLRALGVAIPTAVVYLVVLACPLMMVSMMLGMSHEDDANQPDPSDQAGRVETDQQPSPPANATK